MRARVVVVSSIAVTAVAVIVASRACRDESKAVSGVGIDAHRRSSLPLDDANARFSLDQPEPTGSLRLEGQVIAEGDRPVGGAIVALASEPPRTAVTDADGSFAFDGLLARSYTIAAHREDAFASPRAVLVGPATDPVVLRLARGFTIAVHVIDEKGDPIEGAMASLDDDDPKPTDAGGLVALQGLASGARILYVRARGRVAAYGAVMTYADPGGRIERTVTLRAGAEVTGTAVDPGGRPVAGARVLVLQGEGSEDVEADSHGAWRATITGDTAIAIAEARGYAASPRTSIHLGEANVLRLARGAKLSGVVVDAAGARVARADVVAQIDGARMRATSDSDGAFELEAVPSGEVTLHACEGRRCSPPVTVDVRDRDRTDLELSLREAMIAGIVTDEQGAPVREARIHASSPSSKPNVDLDTYDAVADASGRFEIGPLTGDAYVIRLATDEAHMRRSTVSARPGDRDVRVVVPVRGAVTGSVVSNGKALDRYAVAAVEGRRPFPFVFVERVTSGRFTIEGLEPGAWTIAIVGEATARRDVNADVHAGATTDLGTIDVPLAPTVRGRVIDGNGAGVARARVVVAGSSPLFDVDVEDAPDPWSQAMRGARSTWTDADGRFEVAAPDDIAHLRARASHPQLGKTSTVDVRADADVELRLAATGAIEGVVRGASGNMVIAFPRDGGRQAAAIVDDSGRFRFEDLAAGSYMVSVGVGGKGTSLDVSVAPSAVAHVELVVGDAIITVAIGPPNGVCVATLMPPDDSEPTPRNALAWQTCLKGDPVDFDHVAPGDYRVCVNTHCERVSISNGEHRTIQLSP